ncbi:PREDICTED: protein DDC8 homolog [Hipposideros armiger]|uniref:Protein DDC8 homolog n=1 Tax=Hipposideros armiger TaxID=186990 RepID=A0A8B7RIB6_HIPAR|nr:PREDICTED: protein DDC8 homolog [Hipposideros armiger]
MSAKVSNMKRNAGRDARWIPSPNDEALLLRQKHKLLQVREKGDPPVRGTRDLKPWEGRRLRRVAEKSRAEWQEAPNRQVPGLGRLRCAHLLSMGGGRATEQEPDSQGLAWPGAAWPPRACRKQRAACREEKSCKGGLVRLQLWDTKSPRRAVGAEKKGASRAAGLPYLPLGLPEKNTRKQGPSRKTSSGRRPADPRVRGGPDMGTLWTAAGAIRLLEEREDDLTRDGRGQLGRSSAHLVQSPTDNFLDQSPKGQEDDREQRWPVGSTRGRGTVPQLSPRQCGDKSRWQRELDLAFELLFNTNRKLKRHLSLYLEPRPGMYQNPGERDFSEMQGQRAEPWRETTAADAEVVPAGEAMSSAEGGAHQTSPTTDLQTLLSKPKNQKHQGMVKARSKNEGQLSPSEAGAFISEEHLVSSSPESRHEAPRLDTLSRPRHPQEQADGAGSRASRQKQQMEMEQRRLTQLELPEQTEHPVTSLNLEARCQTELGEERQGQTGAWGQTRARLAHLTASSSRDQEKEVGCELSPTLHRAASILDDDENYDFDDDGHSHMISDLQEQILEQNKLHKQFLEEARKRLREFQKIC